MVLVSACLWGEPTRYDGKHSLCPQLKQQLRGRQVLILCPEVMGGLTVPREPVSFLGARFGQEGMDLLSKQARLVSLKGKDYSEEFIKGAHKVLSLALTYRINEAYLKDRSPSCAYDPEGLNPKGGPGMGLLSTLLLMHGIRVHEVRA